jgi:2-phospho-L-lactate guanylyltransferase
VQATVHTFDPDTGAGSVLTDDGTRLPFEPAAFEGSGLRLLRPGQRLTVEVRDEQVVGLRLLGV